MLVYQIIHLDRNDEIVWRGNYFTSISALEKFLAEAIENTGFERYTLHPWVSPVRSDIGCVKVLYCNSIRKVGYCTHRVLECE